MNNNISLKIVVAETSVIVRSGLAAVLKRIPNLNAHPIEVSSPEALQNFIHLHTPDIVIVNPTFGGWFDLPLSRQTITETVSNTSHWYVPSSTITR